MNESIITLAEAFEAINGYPGLVFGPMATIYPNSYSLIIEGAVREVGGAAGINESNIGPELDLLRMNNPVKAKELEEKIFHGLAIVGGLNFPKSKKFKFIKFFDLSALMKTTKAENDVMQVGKILATTSTSLC